MAVRPVRREMSAFRTRSCHLIHSILQWHQKFQSFHVHSYNGPSFCCVQNRVFEDVKTSSPGCFLRARAPVFYVNMNYAPVPLIHFLYTSRGKGAVNNVNVNVNFNLYSALSHSASNALNAPNTAETDASSIGDWSWRCWVITQVVAQCVPDCRTNHSERTMAGVQITAPTSRVKHCR